MAYCTRCGTKISEEARFCSACGYEQGIHASAQSAYAPPMSDVQENKAMAILAYLGILVLVPICAAPNSRFARYHANQGLVLMLAEIAYGIMVAILTAVLLRFLGFAAFILVLLMTLAAISFLVFLILGIVNAANGEMKPLPIIGGITLIKS